VKAQIPPRSRCNNHGAPVAQFSDNYLRMGQQCRKIMRSLFGTCFAILVAIGIYVGSALVSLNGLAQAARAGNGAEILARTDLARLRHSLVDQIVAAYLRRIGGDRPVKPLERVLATTFGASIADALVGKLLTEESLTNILKNGAVGVGDTQTADMRRLSEIDTSRILEMAGRLSVVKPVEFLVRLGDTDDSGGISLHFEGTGWKLSGVQLPRSAVQALALSLPKKGLNN
jgi:hypothetical protein